VSPESLEGNVWDDLSRIEKEEKAQHSLRRTTTRTTPAARYLRTFFPGRAVHWPNGQETAIFYCPNVQGPIGRSLERVVRLNARNRPRRRIVTVSFAQSLLFEDFRGTEVSSSWPRPT
jgi:hypothetical protein